MRGRLVRALESRVEHSHSVDRWGVWRIENQLSDLAKNASDGVDGSRRIGVEREARFGVPEVGKRSCETILSIGKRRGRKKPDQLSPSDEGRI